MDEIFYLINLLDTQKKKILKHLKHLYFGITTCKLLFHLCSHSESRAWLMTVCKRSIIAGVSYNVKNGSSFITSKILSENLSNQNKHFWWYYKIVHFGILIHLLSWRKQKHKCLLWLLRLSDELFDVINDYPFLTL